LINFAFIVGILCQQDKTVNPLCQKPNETYGLRSVFLDDITAEAAARTAGVELVFDRKAMASIENFLKAQSRE